MTWQRFNLADVTTEISNTGLNSVSQDTATGIWTVSIDSGDTKKLGSGAAWAFNLSTAWAWSDLQWAAIAIEKTGGSGISSSEMYCFAGIAPQANSTFSTCSAVGLMQDAASSSSIDVGVFHGYAASANPSYSAAQAGLKGVFGAFHTGPGNKLLNATASAVSAYGDPDTWLYTKRATGTVAITGDDSDFGFFLACRRNNSSSGTSTLEFRAHYLVSGKNETFFKDNDG